MDGKYKSTLRLLAYYSVGADKQRRIQQPASNTEIRTLLSLSQPAHASCLSASAVFGVGQFEGCNDFDQTAGLFLQ